MEPPDGLGLSFRVQKTPSLFLLFTPRLNPKGKERLKATDPLQDRGIGALEGEGPVSRELGSAG